MPGSVGNKTSVGLSENIAAMLCYVLGWISGVVFLVLEKENQFVRFHALQSLATFLSLFILSVATGFIPIIGLIVSLIVGPLSLLLWLFLMYKAYLGEKYKVPITGDWAEKQINM